MEPHETGIDTVLRRSLSAPVPTLPPDFDKRLMRELNRDPRVVARYRRILLALYCLVAVVTSAVIMRGQGLAWGPTAVMIVGPLALVGAWSLRSKRRTASSA